jgi:MFS family permease
MNAAGLPGRVIPALLSDFYIGAINTYLLTLLCTCLTLFTWPFVKGFSTMLLWAIAYGYCAGGVASLLQAGIASLNEKSETKETIGLGTKVGMGFSVVAFAGLLGAPLGGVLIQAGEERGAQGRFLWLQISTGAMIALGCLGLGATRVVKTGWKLWRKV